MKKNLTLLVLICGILTSQIKAQNFGGGIILGVSSSQVSGDHLGGFNKAGLLAGGYVNIKLNSSLKLQMEMTFIQKGSNNPKMNENNISDISSNYFSAPLLLKYHQSESIQIEAGVETALLISAHDNDLYGKIPIQQSRSFNSIDLGAFVGFNYKLTDYINLNTRIGNSIIPIREHASGTTFKLNKGQYNSVLSFALHYTL